MTTLENPEQIPDGEAVLLDTDVFSHLLRGGHRAAPWEAEVEGRYALISFVTLGELRAWAELKGWGATRRAELEKALESTVLIPFDRELTREYARVVADATRLGHALAGNVHVNDRWIAATARSQGVPLLTANRQHFEGLPGLRLLPDQP